MKRGPGRMVLRPFGGGAGGALVPPASYPLSGLTCSCSLASASIFAPYSPERLCRVMHELSRRGIFSEIQRPWKAERYLEVSKRPSFPRLLREGRWSPHCL
jgi:hypothetical protein